MRALCRGCDRFVSFRFVSFRLAFAKGTQLMSALLGTASRLAGVYRCCADTLQTDCWCHRVLQRRPPSLRKHDVLWRSGFRTGVLTPLADLHSSILGIQACHVVGTTIETRCAIPLSSAPPPKHPTHHLQRMKRMKSI